MTNIYEQTIRDNIKAHLQKHRIGELRLPIVARGGEVHSVNGIITVIKLVKEPMFIYAEHMRTKTRVKRWQVENISNLYLPAIEEEKYTITTSAKCIILQEIVDYNAIKDVFK